MTPERIRTDVLILGAGGAGLFAALHARAAAPALDVTIAVKGLLGKSGCTRMVQGGYNVALAEGDSVERHFMDTIEGGKWLPDQDLAWTLVTGAVERIRELENELGCFFDRNPDGTVHQKAFAGQTFDRTVHKGDLTGIEIVNRLAEQVWSRGIRRLEEHRALEFVRAADGALAGVLLVDVRTGAYRFVQAKAVLLATGGGPTMYRFHTPSGDKSCDGLAMAMRLGLPLRDMEMVQFHPTGLLAGAHTRMTGTVLEEGLRGAGGYLLDGDGQRFMARYDPRAERATRDIVSRAIFAEMKGGRTSGNGGVYLAMGHLGADNVRRQFKGMVDRCADCGFDLAGGRVEVVPTAHYMMGGVEFAPDCTTEVAGLFVAGEDSGGVHGANRLGGNGVANSTVFGGIAGDSIARWLRGDGGWREPVPADLAAAVARADAPLCARDGAQPPRGIEELREALFTTMWDDAGIVRDAAGLARAEDMLARIGDELGRFALPGDARARGFNLAWHDVLNLANLTAVSRVIVRAAQARENSRGAHFRSDFEAPGDLATSTYTQARVTTGGRIDIAARPVRFTRVRPGESLVVSP
jgi:fumarate reductase flavoprotein subunit